MLIKCLAILAATLFLGGLACAVAAADDNPPVTLDLKDVEVKSAIEALFRGKPGKNFSVSQDVSGIVPSLSISNVPFDSALKSLLKTAGLVYRIENNVYTISKKPDTNPYAAVTDPGAAAVIPTDGSIDTTTTIESVIDKVPLSNTGARQLLDIMSGNSQQYGGGLGGGMGYGGMMMGMGGGYGGMMGMGGGYGSMMGMAGGYGGSRGSSYGAGSSYGGSHGGSYPGMMSGGVGVPVSRGW